MSETFSRGLAVSIGLVAALLVVDAGLTYHNTRQLDEDARWVAHTHEVLDALAAVISTAKDAETGQRGFLITGEPRYLEPYHAAVAAVAGRVERVADLTADAPDQQARLPALRQHLAAKLEELEKTIRLRRDRGFDAAREIVLTDRGKAAMDALRSVVQDMEGGARARLREREQRTRRSYYVAVVTGVLTALLGLVLVGLLVAVLRRYLRARQAAAAVLHEQRELFRTTLASIGDAVITTDVSGKVTFLNAVAQGLTGWSQEEAAGRPLMSVFRIVDEQTRQPAEDPASRSLREGTVVGLANHTVLIARGGGERPIDDSAAPIRNEAGTVAGVVLVFRDVTERRRLERLQQDLHQELERQVRERTAELRTSEERFRLLVEGTHDYAIFMLDPAGHVVSWNPGAERIKGYRADEIIGQHFSRFYGEEEVRRGGPDERLRVAAAEGRFEEEGWRVRKDGSRFWASMVITALYDEAGTLRGFSKVTRDLTTKKQAEENARRLLQEQAARRAAEEAEWQVRASEGRLRLFVEHVPAAVAMFDRDLRYLLYSGRWLTDFHLGSQDLTGRHHYDVFPNLPERWKEVHRRCLAGAVESCAEDRFTGPDGREEWLRWEIHPWRDDQGAIGGILIFSEVITERRRIEGALRQSEEQFRRAVVGAPIPIVMHAEDGEVLQLSRAWERLSGYTLEEIPTFAAWLERAFGPEAGRVDAELRQLFEGPPGDGAREYTLTTRAGEKRVWHFTASAPGRLRDGRRLLVAMATDVTERRRAEQSARFLADASGTLAALVDERSTLQKLARLAVPFFADWCAVDMLDEAGSVRRVAVAHVDPAKVELAHELQRCYPPDPEAPQGVWPILRTGRSEIITEMTDALLADTVSDPELLRILRELGLKSYVGVPLRARGKVLGVITFVAAESGRRYDATDLAVAEDLAHRAGIAVENARLYRELREADRLKDEFLAMLAHELRNPLAPIRNALHIMKQPRADAAIQARVRDMADRQVRHMARLLDDLLDVSRISRGKIELRREVVDVAAVVTRTVEALRPLAEGRRHELTVALPAEPVWVAADPTRLEQVVSNLLNNSVKYTDPGGHIRLSVEHAPGAAVVRVRDDGIGIEPAMLPRVFDLFVQAERRLDRSQGGIGIGLTLVKRLVTLHGGTVEAFSLGLGQGSAFVLRLPALDKGAVAAAAGPEEHHAPAAARARRVLVVDDNEDAAESLAMLLRLEGQDTRVAFNGPAALQLAEEFRPEVVFLDIGMPGMDGYEVARRLRALPPLRGVILVAQTGWGQDEDRRRSQEAGFDRHLVKPTDPAAVRALLVALDATGP